MSDRPTVQLDTPFGLATVTVTSGDYIYVEMGRNDDMIVNRVPMHLSLYMSRYADGFACTPSGLYLTRTDTLGKDPSCAARKRVMDTMVPLVSKWAMDNPDVMEEGFVVDRAEWVERAKHDLEAMESNVAGKRDEIRTIEDEVFSN